MEVPYPIIPGQYRPECSASVKEGGTGYVLDFTLPYARPPQIKILSTFVAWESGISSPMYVESEYDEDGISVEFYIYDNPNLFCTTNVQSCFTHPSVNIGEVSNGYSFGFTLPTAASFKIGTVTSGKIGRAHV